MQLRNKFTLSGAMQQHDKSAQKDCDQRRQRNHRATTPYAGAPRCAAVTLRSAAGGLAGVAQVAELAGSTATMGPQPPPADADGVRASVRLLLPTKDDADGCGDDDVAV